MRIASLLLLIPVSLFAHPGHPAGPLSGLWHPFTGADHFLVMLAVGFTAMHMGGRMKWIAPALFLSSMAAGYLSAFAAAPWLETMIQMSLVAFALLLASGQRLPGVLFAALVVFAGLFHGAAHAEGGSSIAYACGFLLATAALHGLGLALGKIGGRAGKWMGRALAALLAVVALAG